MQRPEQKNMENLKVFASTTTESSTEGLKLNGAIQLQNLNLKIEFQIEDPNLRIDYQSRPKPSSVSKNRGHELWQYTCFETFWALPGQNNYWEFNIATNGIWNLYYFDSYRSPSVPQECFDFELSQFNFENNVLFIVLECKKKLSAIDASLTAVIKTKSDQTFYFASCHAGKKPDFHLRESLQIYRSNQI